jgi:hypothetical protein
LATEFGQPGAGAAKKALVGLVIGPALGLVFILFAIGMLSFLFRQYGPLLGLVGVAIAAVSLWSDRDVFIEIAEARRGGGKWWQGAKGEFAVHKAFAALPPEYAVFHDYHPQLKGGGRADWNVDHVVVGPSGVFVIETKNYSKPRVSAGNPYNKKNVKQVRGNAIELKERLSLWSARALDKAFVVPILVYAQEGAFVEKTREADVHVIPLKWLTDEILNHSDEHIDVERAGRIVGVLFAQTSVQMQMTFRAEMTAYGALSKQARYDKRDAAVARAADRAAGEAALENPAPTPSTVPTRCPKCGAILVERTAKKGPRAGKRFLGCSAWASTKCDFKFNLE